MRYIISLILTSIAAFTAKILYFNPKTKEIDVCFLLIVVFCCFFIGLKLVDYVSLYASKQNKRDVAFLTVFFILLFLPMSCIEKNEMHISLKENRLLAPKPQLISKEGINRSFGDQFNNWFSDRFFGREKVIKRYNDLQYLLMMRQGNRHAFVGKDGWLYTKRFNSVEMYRNANLFSQEELDKIGTNLEAFTREAHKQGVKQVYFVLSHDKESLYPEFYPDGFFKKNKQSRMDQLKSYISKHHPDVRLLDFYDQLNQVKNQGEILFCKTGTHMNDMGSYYEYFFLINAISKDFPQIKPLSLNDFNIKEDFVCDMDIYNSLHLKKYDKENLKNKILTLKKSKITKLSDVSRQQKDYGDVKKFKNFDQTLPSAIFLGDSFSYRYHQYIAETFSNLYYVYTGAARNFVWFDEEREYIKDNPPDIFIVETTERFLHRFLTFEYPKD